MRKTIFIASAVVMTALVVSAQNVSTFTDPRDGQAYRIVTIGKQTWMAQNLNYAAKGSKCYGESGKVRTGFDKNNKPVTKTLTGGEIQTNCAIYGRLYNWETATTACPAGWHLPDTTEWNTLMMFVGFETIAGIKLRSKTGWNSYENEDVLAGTDNYGFSALPGGHGLGGDFGDAGNNGSWWSATESKAGSAWGRNMNSGNKYVFKYGYDGANLFSVRCVRD